MQSHQRDRLCRDAGVYRGVTTSELDELAAETAASLTASHPDYAVLAARIAISNLHKNTMKSFSGTIEKLYRHTNPKTGSPTVPVIVQNITLYMGLWEARQSIAWKM